MAFLEYLKGRNFGENLIWRIAGKIKFNGDLIWRLHGILAEIVINKQKTVLRPEIARISGMHKIN